MVTGTSLTSHGNCRFPNNLSTVCKQMLSLYGNVYTSGNSADPVVLREAVKGGNLKKEDKAKITKLLNKVEKEEEKSKMPALSLRAMYGN